MDIPDRIAFVDVETTGLRPGADRIAEVAVVTLERGRVDRWSSVVDAFRDGHAPTSPRSGHREWAEAPRFAAIAPAIASRLEGHLVVAHNARFDHAFLRTELEAAGIAFAPQMVCSVMLSRRLCPDLANHDLDSLARAHRLPVTVRHRALPDAELLMAWWCAVVARMPAPIVSHALRTLLAGPLLPAALDPGVVEALPEMPGAFVMRAADNEVLHTGAAANLRAWMTDYFRVGHASGRALALAHRVHRIEWRATRGILGARLHALAWSPPRASAAKAVTWRFTPDAVPCVALTECGGGEESYGCFASPRKARQALARIAARAGVCPCLLGDDATGLPLPVGTDCCGASSDGVARSRALLRLFTALRPLRMEAWPRDGPIALRERGDLLVVDRWRFRGTARVEGDVHELLAQREPDFDPRVYRLVVRALARTGRGGMVVLGGDTCRETPESALSPRIQRQARATQRQRLA